VQTESVHHILKGGGDSIGALGAIQRVYFNIGSCAEQCWLNHLTDLRQIDPQARNFGQTPFDIGQCRRDCPNFRAIEDRVHNMLDFFLSRTEGQARDLALARANQRNAKYTEADLVRDLERNFGKPARWRAASRCSSTTARAAIPAASRRSRRSISAPSTAKPGCAPTGWATMCRFRSPRWAPTAAARCIPTTCVGHVWQEFANEDYHARPTVSGMLEPHDGGRGYYRNVSLVNLWAHAPFLHNNSVGPELCGWGGDKSNPYELYRVPAMSMPASRAIRRWRRTSSRPAGPTIPRWTAASSCMSRRCASC
jgi:hypothetical protein